MHFFRFCKIDVLRLLKKIFLIRIYPTQTIVDDYRNQILYWVKFQSRIEYLDPVRLDDYKPRGLSVGDHLVRIYIDKEFGTECSKYTLECLVENAQIP